MVRAALVRPSARPRPATAAMLVLAAALLWAGRAPRAATLARQVFAYYPYWEMSQGTSTWRWDLVSVVGYFSAEMDGTGAVTSWHGWQADAPALVAEAHDHGAQVVLVVTIFNGTAIHQAITTGRDAAIANIVDAVNEAGADGVNLDFEGLPAADRDNLVSFVSDLAAALRAQVPGAHVSLASPAVDWSDAWDYAGLTAPGAADYLMIMGYDYHWAGGDQAGPVAPLVGSDLWGRYSETWTADDYLALVGAERRGQLLMGVPLYGYDWPTESGDKPSAAVDAADSVIFSESEIDSETYGRQWDDASQTPWYAYQAGAQWHQVWYEDGESLRLKFQMVNAKDLGGIGVWALNYQGDSGVFWGAVEAELTEPDAAPVVADAAPPAPDAGVTPSDAAQDAAGTSDDSGGCDCRVGRAAGGAGVGAGAGGLLALLGVAAGLGRAGRRRRSHVAAVPAPRRDAIS